MTQCPYTYALYSTAAQDRVVGVHGTTMVCIGTAGYEDLTEYMTTIAEVVGLDGQYAYGAWDLGDGRRVVTMGGKTLTWDEVREMLAEQHAQAVQCGYCHMSRDMAKYCNREPEEPEIVDVGPKQTMAYGHVVDLMTYEAAEAGIRWYLERTEGQGEAMLADVSRTAYEIVLRHVVIGDTHYAGDSDYVSAEDAQRLVDAGLADYMEFE